MIIPYLTLLFFSSLLNASGEDRRVYEEHCKIPPANWTTEDQQRQKIDDRQLIDMSFNPIRNRIWLRKENIIEWNGESINKKQLKEFMDQIGSINETIMMELVIDNDANCSDVEGIRKILEESEICQHAEKLCAERSVIPIAPDF
jgi:hypothetical protein